LRYFRDDYTQCVGGSYASYCYDIDAFGGDHTYGWGLVAWASAKNDPAALTAAATIAAKVEALWAPGSSYGCFPSSGCLHYGPRGAARHLLLATRMADATGAASWIQLRDKIVATILASPMWDEQQGMYFGGDWQTDAVVGQGAYAAGTRIQSAFQLGLLSEAMSQAYRATENPELRRRLVAMAGFVEKHGLDPTYQYTSSWFGVKNGATWQSYNSGGPVTFWDPVYTTSLVNVLVRAYQYTCESHYFESAKKFFLRGNGSVYGSPTDRAVPDGVVHHFVDSRFASSTGNFYFDNNKGELLYTYALFDLKLHP
jgi:hypothetical protein